MTTKNDVEGPVDTYLLRMRIAAATKLPWRQAIHAGEPRALVADTNPNDSLLGLDAYGMVTVTDPADASLIIAAVNALPKLIEEVDAARRVVRAAIALTSCRGVRLTDHTSTSAYDDLTQALEDLADKGGF